MAARLYGDFSGPMRAGSGGGAAALPAELFGPCWSIEPPIDRCLNEPDVEVAGGVGLEAD